MSLNSIPWCHLKPILLSALLLFCCSLDLCSANDEFGVGTTDVFDDVLTLSGFSYPQTTLRPYDLLYIRGWSPVSLYASIFLLSLFMKHFTVLCLMGWSLILKVIDELAW